jgi:hypothetical protein
MIEYTHHIPEATTFFDTFETYVCLAVKIDHLSYNDLGNRSKEVLFLRVSG